VELTYPRGLLANQRVTSDAPRRAKRGRRWPIRFCTSRRVVLDALVR
jgi:hypothetical protein